MTWQVATAPLPVSEQDFEEKLPDPLLLNNTVPLGVIGVPLSTSLTVAVHVVWLSTGTETGLQLRLVELARSETFSVWPTA